MTWHDLHHSDLGVDDLYDVLALRNRVFVVEQDCCYQDIDGLDLVADTRHLLARASSGSALAQVRGGAGVQSVVGYARLLAPAAGEAGAPARIGRVIVSAEARGQALGRRLMERALASCATHWPDAGVELSAQAHLRAFYASLGFEPVSDVYDEDGIPHVDMRLTP
ncbi:GNAT family N-acetyltransferase [Nocardioides guangzhouensis]|uniref:GNAT family N-acetyltransferase n=1 Tax=Nocardioides guangzhouensis TaxID=2497878 RepID=A0A4Q4Z2E1_9ACTN|nr:GNAT family N-acetyltransferase [Nocardioides guangzhouensis]